MCKGCEIWSCVVQCCTVNHFGDSFKILTEKPNSDQICMSKTTDWKLDTCETAVETWLELLSLFLLASRCLGQRPMLQNINDMSQTWLDLTWITCDSNKFNSVRDFASWLYWCIWINLPILLMYYALTVLVIPWAVSVVVLMIPNHCYSLLNKRQPCHCSIKYNIFLIIDCTNQHTLSGFCRILMHQLTDGWIIAWR